MKCLFCYKELADNEIDFHSSCSRKIFGATTAPELPYTRDNLTELARQVVRSQTTLTGVQAKLSLDIKKAVVMRQRDSQLLVCGEGIF